MAKRVQFNDLSKPGDDGPITAWAWDFGDPDSGAQNTSALQNPYHDYATSGTYIVKLTITGSGTDGTDDVTHNLTVDVPVPIADFSSVVTGLSVAFTDHSEPGPSGPITNYAWDFGDGTTGGTGGGGGQFPTTGILDDFNLYATGTLNGKGNWLAPLGGSATGELQVGTNAIHTINPPLAVGSAYLSPTYGPDVEAYCTLVALDTQNPGSYMRLFARCQNPTSATTRSQYQINVKADGNWRIERVKNNATATILGTYTQAISVNDKIGISIIGQVITAWWWDASDSTWHVVGTYTDDSVDKITAAGKVGLILEGRSTEQLITLDDFGGGTYVPGGGDPANPTHVYSAPGSYSVKLTVTGTGTDGTDEVTKNVVAVAAAQLTAIFTSTRSGPLVSFNSYSTPGPSGPITAYNWDFGDGSTHGTTQNPTHTYAASGTYTVRLTVTGTGADGTNYIEHSVDVVVPPPSGGTIFEQFIAKSNFSRPAFTPTRTVRFKDKAGLDAALADLRAGDLVKYDPASFGLTKKPLVISSNYQIRNKKLSGRAVLDFGCSHNVWDSSKIVPDFVSFTETRIEWEAFSFIDNTNLDVWGGDYHSDHGAGFRFMGNVIDCQCLDLYCHDIGGSGVGVQSIDSHTGEPRTIDGLVIRAEINRFSMDPSIDPHDDKGTGSHGAIIHGNGGHTDNCHFYFYAHDPLRPGESAPDKTGVVRVWPEGAGGSACEPGCNWSTLPAFSADHSNTSQNNNHYTVYGENLLMTPMHTGCVNPGSTASQTGGNLMDNWGSVPMNGMICDFLGGVNLSGAIMHGAGGGWGTNANPRIKVLIGRGYKTNQFVGGGGNVAERYVSGKNIDYVDCT